MLRFASATVIGMLVGGVAIAADAPTSDAPGTGPIPIQHFTRYDEFGDIKLSPSGEHFAFLTGKYGRSMIAFMTLKDRKLVGGVRCREGMEIYDFDWVSNSRIIFRIAERQLGEIEPTVTGEIFAVNVDGKGQDFIYGYRAGESRTGTLIRGRESSYATPELISPTLKDPKHVLIAEYPWRNNGDYWFFDRDAKPLITQLDIQNGNKRKVDVAPLASATVLTDFDDNPRIAIGQSKEFKIAASWKPTPDAPWTELALPGFREESVIPHVFGEDHQSLYFTGVREGEAHSALYTLNLSNNAVTKLHGFADADIADVVLDLTRRKVVGVESYKEKPAFHWLNADDRAARIYSALHRAFPNQMVNIVTATQDGKLAVVFVSSDVNPGDYYLFDTQAMKADYLLAGKRWINPTTMRSKEPFTIAARDGLKLHGYVTRPRGDAPYPLVVLPHGGPHGVRDYWGYDWEVQLLASRGYAVLQLNFRGSDGYGMDFESAGFREWGAKMQDDLTDATRWAIDRKIADANRICIYGASYGGFAALQGAAREPSLYRCAIGYAGVYDLELMHSSADIPRSKSGRAYLKLALGDDRADLRSRSPVYNAEKIQAPVLLIHGKEDFRADFEQAKRMKAALERHGKKFEWMSLSREGHGVYDEETRVEVYEKILGFLDKHLMRASGK